MSTIACDAPHSTLDEPAWRAVCKTAAEHAQRGCGLSWDHWVTLFSSEVDAQVSRLPQDQRTQALEIAARERLPNGRKPRTGMRSMAIARTESSSATARPVVIATMTTGTEGKA